MKERWEVTGKPCLICRSHSGSTIGNRKEMWFGNFPLSLAEQREEWMPGCFTQERKRCCLHAFRWISCPPPACGCGRESCVCLCVCTWNVRVTLCTHWWSSTEKRKLPVMLLMLINSLQLCNGTMIIIKSHAWRLQGQEKQHPPCHHQYMLQIPLGPDRGVFSSSMSSGMLRTLGTLYLPVHVEIVLLPEVIQNLLLGFGNQVIFSLSKRQQFDARFPGICSGIYLVLWHGLNFCEGIYGK